MRGGQGTCTGLIPAICELWGCPGAPPEGHGVRTHTPAFWLNGAVWVARNTNGHCLGHPRNICPAADRYHQLESGKKIRQVFCGNVGMSCDLIFQWPATVVGRASGEVIPRLLRESRRQTAADSPCRSSLRVFVQMCSKLPTALFHSIIGPRGPDFDHTRPQ